MRRGAARARDRDRQPHRGRRRRRHRSAHPGGRLVATVEAARLDVVRDAAAPRATLKRLWRLKWALVATVITLGIVASAVFAPWIAPHDPLSVNIRHRLAPPAWM